MSLHDTLPFRAPPLAERIFFARVRVLSSHSPIVATLISIKATPAAIQESDPAEIAF